MKRKQNLHQLGIQFDIWGNTIFVKLNEQKSHTKTSFYFDDEYIEKMEEADISFPFLRKQKDQILHKTGRTQNGA